MKRSDGNSPFHSNVGEPGPPSCRGLLVRERRILEGFTYTWNLEKVNSLIQKVDCWLPGAEDEGNREIGSQRAHALLKDE